MHARTGRFAGTGIALLTAWGLGGCSEIKPVDPQQTARARAEAKRQQSACASPAAYDRLKRLLFDQAISERGGDRSKLDTLADYSFVRMEEPVVKGWDERLDITRCEGRFILDIPPGAEAALGGQKRLQANIAYTAQAAADGRGFVYQVEGASDMVATLAGFNLTGSAYRPLPAIDDQRGRTEGSDDARVAAADEPAVPSNADPVRPPSVSRQGATPVERAPEREDRRLADDSRDAPVSRGGEATIRAFYDDLHAGNGERASARIVPEKRATRAFSPAAISRFYGHLPEPIRLIGITPLSGGAYRVRYRYSAGRSRCDGRAVVRLTNRAGRDLIQSIQSLSHC